MMRARDVQRSHIARPATDEREITRTTNEHCRNTWRQFVVTLDRRVDPSKLWRTIKAIDGKSPPKTENRQITTSKLGRHTSFRETRIVSIEIKQKSLMPAVTFTMDQVIKGISNCSNTKAFDPDKHNIFHLKNLGHRALNTSPHSSMTPSHHVESRRFESHLLSSLSPNTARTLL